MTRRRRREPRGQHHAAAPATDHATFEWVDYCGGRMFVVGHTEGGVPFGVVEWDSGDSLDEEHLVGHDLDMDDEPF